MALLLVLRFEVSIDAAEGFDTWLRDHVADMLQQPGVQAAALHDAPGAENGMALRAVHYRLSDSAVAQALAMGQPAAPEAGKAPAFCGAVLLSRELLEVREDFAGGAPTTENCLNCGEVLSGQHCAHCGQRARVRVLSVWALLRDVAGDLLSWDARVWRTLWPLAFKPGFLTREYLMGRRTAYTPPFRMYLVLSLLFFLLAPLGSDLELQLDHAGQAVIADATTAAPDKELPSGLDARRVCGEELKVELGLPGEEWEPRIRQACQRVLADPGAFGKAMLENVPPMMFVFLPLVALLMQLLYAGSRRFYVEHLLFFVHVHGAFFLGALVVVLMEQGARVPAPVGTGMAWASGTASSALMLYLPYYLYRSMRCVYRQGRALTLLKGVLLCFGYVVCLSLTVTGLFLFTALER